MECENPQPLHYMHSTTGHQLELMILHYTFETISDGKNSFAWNQKLLAGRKGAVWVSVCRWFFALGVIGYVKHEYPLQDNNSK